MKKILFYFSVVTAALLLASCEDFLDVNKDPNNPTEVTPSLILPVAQHYTAQVMHDNRRINTLGNMMMYNWSQSDGYAWYPDEFKYLVTSSFYQGIFNDTYSRALKQYDLLDKLTDSRYDYYKAISKIMKAFHFQLLVDLYGDVPYSEALQRSENSTPKYDDALTIYEDLIVQLTSAIDIIKNAQNATVPGADDAMFGGDMDKWVKFANTLKMRILVRQSNMTSRTAYIQSAINNIIAEGSGFITTDVKVNPGYVAQVDKQNPMWDAFGKDASGNWTMNHKATCATDYIISFLGGLADPRINFIYQRPASGTHLGVPQGLLDYDIPVVDQYMPEKVSLIGPGILKGANMGSVIFTLAESYFNLAEAAQKALITGNAKDYYDNGVIASFNLLGAPGASAYITSNVALKDWNATPNKIELIITQKWIAVNGMTAEQSWFDYSRTGYPSGLPISRLSPKPDRPVRLFYPAGETTSNGANLPSQPDAFTAKIFWAN
jgi:hypothetical protein